MRLATFVQRPNPQPPISEDPADVYEYGVVPAHRLIGPVFVQNGARLKLRGAPGDPVLVRLPRRLSVIRSAEDAISWIRGLDPAPSATVPGLAAVGSAQNRWERAYPGRGLGLPKPLPRRRVRRALHDDFASVRPALDLAIQMIKRSALALTKGRFLSEITQINLAETLAGIGLRSLYEHGVHDVRLDVRLVNDPHGRGLVDPARPTLGLQIWSKWCVP